MNIEVGKFYKTRSGLKVKIYSTDDLNLNNEIHGAIFWMSRWKIGQWNKKGFFYTENEISRFDIISEWEELNPIEKE